MAKLIDNVTTELIASPLTATSSWQNVGDVTNIGDIMNLSLWVDYTINASTELLIKAVVKKTPTSVEEFDLPIHIVASASVGVTPQVYSLPIANSKIVLGLSSVDVISFIQFKVRSTSSGAHAVLNSAAMIGALLVRR